MNSYRNNNNIKVGLFFVGLILIIGLLGYSNSIVNRLRDDNRNIVKLYSEIIAKTVNEDSDTNLNFVFDEIIKKVQFPIIYSDAKNTPIYSRNISGIELPDQLKKPMGAMDRQNDPIPISYYDQISGQSIPLGFLHYGDSDLIRKLQWLPYLEIGVVAMFIFIGFMGFNSIRNSEKRNIWVGMARETAHQLGTPVSALMGWVDRIKRHPEESSHVVQEMESDLERLNQIGTRFSKMGSQTVLNSISLKELVNRQTGYLKKRMPSLGKDIELRLTSNEDINIEGNEVLLGWAIENVIRNGIDSIKGELGTVEIKIYSDDNYGIIQLKDNGSGIQKKDWKNIFRPGFSTKERGWGLGLSLVNRIIGEIHGGEIKVIHSEIGVGTTFEISLKKSV
ncbi:MAG: HAMP domain-containing histidine kinase [Candidatus Marinimicrobia bacterium]|jgi:signal transduction histidine kinase|nr:HAMP domain-containing histidine kinase [Candidatus Neomarinimicrobiota bacterium]MBT3946549.1 HAMP domain-containing histidine kinase [Candidatus Neomarinimicrobiota bacterium]MBT4063723.1 HAMP domain-containing histidine kinase [Candidatus Neomarinimicrobiota bacterium]MBT4307417.1 HAMP domain-containing histidine kinase [Candidatus Neomarinimicrobiota bacterium]MBT4453275.1 HAMP domain-containing histidine kinase [Candidatus Neomarinimicrobiota bacterium]|tara:strand:+ start:1212 stop:2387 length:1176 start_codon:yes stop_codon:yes gene_type:complete